MDARQRFADTVDYTRQLKKQVGDLNFCGSRQKCAKKVGDVEKVTTLEIEAEISKKYPGRPVNIMGSIHQALAPLA